VSYLWLKFDERRDHNLAYHVSKERFGELVEQALAELPSPFDEYIEEVPVELRDRPTLRQLQSVGLDSNHLLLGLYDGVPLTQRSVEQSGVRPPVIYIFRDHIELACRSEQELVEQVRKTVLHEVGHHFGMNEQDLDELGYG
jgi:predicted Zn-dependent protease with MMP-like domain